VSGPYYDGVTAPNPERQRLFLSVFNPSPLEEVAKAVSVASGSHQNFYVERRGHQWRWSVATKGGPYPLLRITAQFLRMDYAALGGVGSREVGDGWCCQIVDEGEKPDAWAVLWFDEPTPADRVGARVLTEVLQQY
jgi:hypothetical protein